jgi:hypothetical protein
MKSLQTHAKEILKDADTVGGRGIYWGAIAGGFVGAGVGMVCGATASITGKVVGGTYKLTKNAIRGGLGVFKKGRKGEIDDAAILPDKLEPMVAAE